MGESPFDGPQNDNAFVEQLGMARELVRFERLTERIASARTD